MQPEKRAHGAGQKCVRVCVWGVFVKTCACVEKCRYTKGSVQKGVRAWWQEPGKEFAQHVAMPCLPSPAQWERSWNC